MPERYVNASRSWCHVRTPTLQLSIHADVSENWLAVAGGTPTKAAVTAASCPLPIFVLDDFRKQFL